MPSACPGHLKAGGFDVAFDAGRRYACATIDAPTYRAAGFELRPYQQQLVVDGARVTIGSRALAVLEVLACRAGELVTKQELLDRVWPDSEVQEGNLSVQISALRKALGADVIATIPGRGYRLVAAAPPPLAPQSPARETPLEAVDPPAAPVGLSAGTPKLRTNLRGATPALLGRADDLVAVLGLVGRHRLVTVLGGGGMGKTLLARHVLARSTDAFPHGVCWVELGPVADAAAVPGAVAAALGVESGAADELAALAAWAAPLDMLVALDNAEHCLDEVAVLAQRLLDASPSLRLLVTSQMPLRLPAECVYRLEPLAVPPAALPLDEALRFGAVALLAERAHAADARLALNDATVPALVEICRALDGVPLAIELAAARAPLLGLEPLARSLRERLELLTVNANRWAPIRQQTLRHTLQWSHGLLTPHEQQVFRRLGVLVGSASLPTLQALGGAEASGEAAPGPVIDALAVLVDRSLVKPVRAPGDGEAEATAAVVRYRLLESARYFALEQLRERRELDPALEVHARCMARLCDAAWNARWSGDTGLQTWIDVIEPDLDDAFEAFAWASASGDSAIAMRIARTLLYALPATQSAQRARIATYCESLPDHGLPLDLRLQARLALCSHWMDRRWPRAAAAVDSALPLARQLAAEGGDVFWLYMALNQRASLDARHGRVSEALAVLAECRPLAAPDWPPHRLLVGASTESFVARATGDLPAALAFQRRRLALRRAAGGSIFAGLSNLMDAEIAAGEAAAAVQTGLDLERQLTGTREELLLSTVRLNLLAARLALAQPSEAREVAGAGWEAACRLEQQAPWADHLAWLAAQESRFSAAARLCGYARHAHAARGSARDYNEATAFDRAASAARDALGEAVYDRLAAQGEAVDDAEALRLATGRIV